MYEYKVLNYEAYDGDTIKVLLDLGFYSRIQVSARLVNVDTPETRGSSKWTDDYEALHKQAGALVSEVVEAWLQFAGDGLGFISVQKDKYSGRAVGEFFKPAGHSREFLSTFLLNRGLALAYDGGTKQEWTEARLNIAITSARAALDEIPLE